MSNKQVIYFYEGETEKKLLEFLKNTKQIRPGKLKKFNLWKQYFKKIEKTINKTDELFFVVDTDDVNNIDIFTHNAKKLESYTVCLIVQHKNLEDELCFSCGKDSNRKLFSDFYQIENSDKFKSKFNKEKNLKKRLLDNDFAFDRLWTRGSDFFSWSEINNISININCNYKEVNSTHIDWHPHLSS